MTHPKLSIIVPVYNTEKYLSRCIDSVLCQSFTDFELLLIDDGSKDGSGVVCDVYAENDNRIRVFHKENGGVSSVRQLGMDKAQGEYVIHVDSDDYVESTMLERLYKCASENDSDVVICDFYVNQSDCEYIVKQQPSSVNHLVVLSEMFQHLHGSCWNKLLRRDCYKKYNVSFPVDVSYCEDLSFWVCLLKNSLTITYLPEAFYHYVQHDSSIVHNYMNKKNDDGWKLMMLLNKELKDYPEIKRKAKERVAFNVVGDAYKYGAFNNLSFVWRYAKYVPNLLRYKYASLHRRFFYAGVCLGMYSYYKNKQEQSK